MATKSADEEEMDTEDAAPSPNDTSVKVPEDFQRQATELVQSCSTMACLDYLSSEVSEARTKLMKSQTASGLDKTDFDMEGGPSPS